MASANYSPIDGVLLISKGENQVPVLQRVLSHIGYTWVAQVDSIREADAFMSQARPELLFIDLTDMSPAEYLGKLEPFVLTLPRGVRIFLVSPEPTVENVVKASEIGVDGMLKSISSHYSIATVIQKLRKNSAQEQAEAHPN